VTRQGGFAMAVDQDMIDDTVLVRVRSVWGVA
jgi:hypothetical protein